MKNCKECKNCYVWHNGKTNKYYCQAQKNKIGHGLKPIRPTIDWCGCALAETKPAEAKIITVKYSVSAYIARCEGKVASSTMCAQTAVEAVAIKVGSHGLAECVDIGTWRVQP